MLKYQLTNKYKDSVLQRFLGAHQNGDEHGCPLKKGLDELKKKKVKHAHWSWYGFPQLRSRFSRSDLAKKYSISDLEEAIQYVKDPALFNNLVITFDVIIEAINHNGGDITRTLGPLDDNKFVSSVTLFYLVGLYLKSQRVPLPPGFDQIKSARELFGDLCEFTVKAFIDQLAPFNW